MKVATPRPGELNQLVDLAKDMWAESAFSITDDFDELATFDFGLLVLTEHLSGGDYYIGCIKDDEGNIYAMMIGQVTPYFFCPSKKMALDHALYVTEEKRGSSAAYRLLKEFEKWAISRGAIEVSLGVSTGVNPKKTHDFYIKMGYNHTGGIYKKPLKQEQEEI